MTRTAKKSPPKKGADPAPAPVTGLASMLSEGQDVDVEKLIATAKAVSADRPEPTRRPDRTAPANQAAPAQAIPPPVASVRPQQATAAAAPQAALPAQGSRPWATAQPSRTYTNRPRRPPGAMVFRFQGRVVDGRPTDAGATQLRVEGDGWFTLFIEACPDWLAIGTWVDATGIIAGGQAGKMYMWIREVKQIAAISQ